MMDNKVPRKEPRPAWSASFRQRRITARNNLKSWEYVSRMLTVSERKWFDVKEPA